MFSLSQNCPIVFSLASKYQEILSTKVYKYNIPRFSLYFLFYSNKKMKSSHDAKWRQQRELQKNQ